MNRKHQEPMTPYVQAQYDRLRTIDVNVFLDALDTQQDWFAYFLCDEQLLRLTELQVRFTAIGADFGRELPVDDMLEVGAIIAAVERRAKDLFTEAKARHAQMRPQRTKRQ